MLRLGCHCPSYRPLLDSAQKLHSIWHSCLEQQPSSSGNPDLDPRLGHKVHEKDGCSLDSDGDLPAPQNLHYNLAPFVLRKAQDWNSSGCSRQNEGTLALQRSGIAGSAGDQSEGELVNLASNPKAGIERDAAGKEEMALAGQYG